MTSRQDTPGAATTRDAAALLALMADFLRTSPAARGALARYGHPRPGRPGLWPEQVIADLEDTAALLAGACDQNEGIHP